MKKQIKKIYLSKRTVSNLTGAQMSKYFGGGSKNCGGGGTTEYTMTCGSCYAPCTITCQGHTCHGNKCL